eukprot:7570333-Alexandrium_andersonii.AAC.1
MPGDLADLVRVCDGPDGGRLAARNELALLRDVVPAGQALRTGREGGAAEAAEREWEGQVWEGA